MARGALDFEFILIRTIRLPIPLCLLIRFDTLIRDLERQYEFVTHLLMRLLVC